MKSCSKLQELPFKTKVAHEDESSSAESFSYPESFLPAVRRGTLAKSISEMASDWLVLTPDIVFLPCFYGIRLWIWPSSISSEN
jgi:hypothetical protein